MFVQINAYVWTYDNQQLSIAGVSGLVGGICGQPADLVNVRMQNDMKRPPAERRNYRHCFDGLARVYRHGGLSELYAGVTMMAGRSALMTVGQAVGYDQWKNFLLRTGYFDDVLVSVRLLSFVRCILLLCARFLLYLIYFH